VTLSDREKKILRAVIESYIASARPVSSSAVVRCSWVSLSSATVRNVMRALEDKGLILQPHTSAGRIPTDLGYRYYVDNLVRPAGLSPREAAVIDIELARLAHRDMSGILGGISHLMSELTRELAVAVAPLDSDRLIERVELVAVGEDRVLAVVSTTDGGPARTAVVTTSRPLRDSYLSRVSGMVNDWVAGMAVPQALGEVDDRVRTVERELDEEHVRLLEGVRSCLAPGGVRSVHYDGARYIFRHPEFSSDASSLGEILDSEEALAEVVRGPERAGAVRVVIGHENVRTGMQHMSLVSGTYRIGTSTARMGVIGPTRMKYRRLMGLVGYFTKALDKLFSGASP
jgi:heat-inducible transcriptional repressor